MNKLFITIVISLCICGNASAKKDKLYLVSVPDSISFVLDEAYEALTKRGNVNAGVNVHNVINYKKNIFENGLYCFGGMGPHFPKLLFIYYNSTLYIINARMIQDILQQMVEAYSLLKIKEQDFVVYVKYALDYIEYNYKDKFSYYGIQGD